MSVLLCAAVMCAAVCAAGAAEAEKILQTSGVKGGLVVHLNCGDGKLTAALRADGRYLVHGLDTNPANVATARGHIRKLGVYGKVSVDTFDGRRLPYVDNLVNLVVADDPGDVSADEIARVLAPLGVAMIGGKRTVKPWPAEMDEWRQYLHDADNNAVSHDALVGPPRHLQWVCEPAWSRSHMAIPTVVSMVSSRGRLFSIEDTTTVENPFLPGKFSLIARDAFNGIVLWKHDFARWESITRYIKDIAVQLQRRLVAIGDVVYCTPGLDAPVTAFDAATGKVVRTYKGTRRTQEFAYDKGVLYLVIGDRMNSARYNIVKTQVSKGINLGGSDPKAPFGGTGFRGSYAPEVQDLANPTCEIVAVRADSGKELWRKKDIRGYTGCSLAIRAGRAVYQTAAGLFCLNAETGGKVWSVDKQIAGADGTEANTLVLTDDSVYAKEGGSLVAYRLKDGSQKWKAPIANNYEKSADLFLAAGSVWTGGSKPPASYDPRTGERKLTIKQRMLGPMGHDRCYRNFITDRFYINSKTGGADFLTLDGKREFPNHWLRGTCGMGVLPCNGLLYAPPSSCQCSIGAMIKDFNAVYAEKGLKSSGQMVRVGRKARLVKGPAYGQIDTRRSQIDKAVNWPTYRHDPARSGSTKSAVPVRLTVLWKAKLDTVGSALTAADGKLFVSDIDAHRLCALNASSGKIAWQYVAGARVDSPPTYCKGLVLFGSMDGWVHCIRASDGKLAWRFKDLPDKLIGAFGQLESAWPVSGSVLVKNDIAYFAAGRSSFLDGGIFLYGLNPQTGEVIHSRQVYGPFDKTTGFPAVGNRGFKADIFVTDGKLLYMRHKAFNADLTGAGLPGPHLIASAGFLDGVPQHRTYWTIGRGFQGKTLLRGWQGNRAAGDILVMDEKDFYEVRGFPVQRHSYFDPRVKGYKLLAGSVNSPAHTAMPRKRGPRGSGPRRKTRTKAAKPGARAAKPKWSVNIPMTGKAMLLAGDVVFVAGAPAYFPPNHPVEKYVAGYEGRLGGLLWAVSATDGKKLAEYKLDAPPRWDGLAAANGRLYLATTDGRILAFVVCP